MVYTPIQLSTRTYALPQQPVMAFTILGLKITLPSTPHSSTNNNKDKLVCISTGIVAPSTADADGAIELGELES